MFRYIARRILDADPCYAGSDFMVFTIMEFSPGDPVRIILGDEVTEEAVAQLTKEMGLDRLFLCAIWTSFIS
jgi:peptide/nickel transport system permease protein